MATRSNGTSHPSVDESDLAVTLSMIETIAKTARSGSAAVQLQAIQAVSTMAANHVEPPANHLDRELAGLGGG